MTRTLLALTLALATLCPAAAFAQGDEVRVESFTDADQVTGTYQSPFVDLIGARTRHMRHTLIVPRADYSPEMLRSVENL